MEVLQVKQYNREIAQEKQQKALERWKDKDNGYGYPVAVCSSLRYQIVEVTPQKIEREDILPLMITGQYLA